MTTHLQLDGMTRYELESCIGDLEDEAEELRATIKGQRTRLAEAADLMVELDRIHNTPYAKTEWIAGK